MTGNVWIVAEHWRGGISDATCEALWLGRRTADALGTRLEAVLLGHGARDLAGSLAPADTVLSVDHPTLADASGLQASRAIAALASDRHPAAILVPSTNVSWDLLGLLPAQLDAPLVNFCRSIDVVDAELRVSSLLYGGKMAVTVAVGRGPVVLGVVPGAAPADVPPRAAPSIEDVSLDLPDDPGARLLAYEDPEAGDVDITAQDVLVSIGRGISSDTNIEVAEDLATALGGAVCGSRPVIDQGWLPLSRQVGKSGVTVRPRLYVAAGISGAPEHVEGMKGAELIIAINTDAGAPIFSIAHYGIVDDATDVLEALADAVNRRKG